MTRKRLSPHFTVEEFDCRNGTRVPARALPALGEWCRQWGEPLRREFGPVRVTSGYRTVAYNRHVGGATMSMHVYTTWVDGRTVLAGGGGVAADVVPARGTPAEWQAWARAHLDRPGWALGPRRGAAVAYVSDRFIHLDTGMRRTWVG